MFPAIIIEMFYEKFFGFTSGINNTMSIFYAFIGVGLTEELSKFIFLRWYIYKHKNFSEPMDGVVYAVMVSMGFAAVENVFYVFSSDDQIYTAIVRSLTAVPAHACFGVIMGLYFGYARFTFKRKRVRYLVLSVLLASIAHGFYNVFLFIDGNKYSPLITLLVLLIILILSLRIISRFKRISPFRKNYVLLDYKKRVITLEEILINNARKEELKRKLKKILKKKKTK